MRKMKTVDIDYHYCNPYYR